MKEIHIGAKDTVHHWQWHTLKSIQKCDTFSLIVARQHGKSWMQRAILADFIFRFDGRKNPSALVVGLTAAQVYEIIFSPLYRDIFSHLPASVFTKQGDAKSLLRVTIKRTWLDEPDYVTIEFCGAGSGNAIRGRTKDLVMIDECAFVPDDTYFSIIRPTVSAVGGKIFLTSTVDPKTGAENWFIKNHNTLKEMNRDGHKTVNAMDFTVYEAQHYTDEWIATEKEVHRRAGKMDKWLQEYENNYMIAMTAEAPFAERVYEIFEQDRIDGVTEFPVALEFPHVFASFDIGKPGNNPCWAWVPHGDGALVLSYKDDDGSQYKALERLLKQYPRSYITIIYPNDANQPSVEDGVSLASKIEDYIHNNGLTQRMELIVMNKTKSRPELVRRGVEVFKNSSFFVAECRTGLEKLGAIRMKKDNTTGYISDKDFIKTKMNYHHAGDGFIYIGAALDNYALDYRGGMCYNNPSDLTLQVEGRSLKYRG